MNLEFINFILEDISLIFIIFMIYMCYQQKKINKRYLDLYNKMVEKNDRDK